MRMLAYLLAVGAACSAMGACAASPPTPAPSPTPTPRPPADASLADVVARTLPAVVLLLNEHPDAKTTFGAGFLVQDGLAVTCLHVVDGAKTLTAMLHEPSRTGYTPMDGGLPRFLFENQGDLVPVHIVAKDAALDLAVLRVDADTSGLPKLEWSTSSVRPGERVLALGHPQETVWSFTEGVVGSLQHGIVQHDAVIGPGSSGGPLLNLVGQVIGVNVAHVANLPRGLSYARPIDLVAGVFTSRRVSIPVDLRSPASAAISCWRAQELAMDEAGRCFDWESEWPPFVKTVEESRSMAMSDAARARIAQCPVDGQAREKWIATHRDQVAHVFDPTHWKSEPSQPHDAMQPDPADPAYPPAFRDELSRAIADKKAALDKATQERSVLVDFRDPPKLLARLRQGLRVEQVREVTPSLAWVLLAFKNDDGSLAKLSELYTNVGGAWLQRAFPRDDEVARLPEGWPPPAMTLASVRLFRIAEILKRASSGAGCPLGAPKSEGATAPASGVAPPSLHPRFSPRP